MHPTPFSRYPNKEDGRVVNRRTKGKQRHSWTPRMDEKGYQVKKRRCNDRPAVSVRSVDVSVQKRGLRVSRLYTRS